MIVTSHDNRKRSAADTPFFVLILSVLLVQPLADTMANCTCYDRRYDSNKYLHDNHLLPVGWRLTAKINISPKNKIY